jgi:hypothetical protein
MLKPCVIYTYEPVIMTQFDEWISIRSAATSIVSLNDNDHALRPEGFPIMVLGFEEYAADHRDEHLGRVLRRWVEVLIGETKTSMQLEQLRYLTDITEHVNIDDDGSGTARRP